MIRIENIVINQVAPSRPERTIWGKPTKAGVELYTWNNGEWQPTSGDVMVESLGKALEEEARQRVSDHSVINNAISEEGEARKAADTALQESLGTEASERKSADEALQGGIDAEASGRKSADTALQEGIDGEASARKAADTALQGNIDSEASSRSAADTALQESVDSEALARSNADTALQKAIDSEATDRKAADKAINASIGTINTSLASKLESSDLKTLNGESLTGSGDITIDLTLYRLVSALPTEDIDSHKIYLVLSADSEENDLYTEYIYVNGSWEKLGEYKADIDLSPYLTKTEAGDAYLTKTDAASTYQPKGDYLTEHQDLSAYAQTADVQDTYLSKTDASSTYLKKTDATSTYLSKADATSTYLSKTDASSTYLAQDDAASAYVAKTDYDAKMSGLDNSIGTLTSGVSANATDIGTLESKVSSLEDTTSSPEDVLAYGVSWPIDDPGSVTRVGNLALHKSLPIQSGMRGCVAKNGIIQYYLGEDDWRFRKDATLYTLSGVTLTVTDGVYTITDDAFATLQYGSQYVKVGDVICQVASIDTSTSTATLTPESSLEAGTYEVELGSVLNGYDGEVQVEIPEFYLWSRTADDVCYVYVSTHKCVPYAERIPRMLMDAYMATLLNTVPEGMGYLSTLVANSAISVVNTEAYCRGGGNRSAYDCYFTGTSSTEGDTAIDVFRTDLGKPRTSVTRAAMRTYSANAGKVNLCYEYYKAVFFWLYVIEYGNFNSQAAYNSALTSDGYRQGGLGNGLTTRNWSYWSYYNGNCAVTPMGYGNGMGNGTGVKSLSCAMPTASGSTTTQSYTFSMPRWRGFDNPFGDIWTNLDGFISAHGSAWHKVYTTKDPDLFGDDATALSGMRLKGLETASQGLTKRFSLGENAEIIPCGVGSPNIGDYHWTNTTSGYFTLMVGGSLDDGSYAGLGGFYSYYGVAISSSCVGLRCLKVLDGLDNG